MGEGGECRKRGGCVIQIKDSDPSSGKPSDQRAPLTQDGCNTLQLALIKVGINFKVSGSPNLDGEGMDNNKLSLIPELVSGE
jgi:hypothetical protein